MEKKLEISLLYYEGLFKPKFYFHILVESKHTPGAHFETFVLAHPFLLRTRLMYAVFKCRLVAKRFESTRLFLHKMVAR